MTLKSNTKTALVAVGLMGVMLFVAGCGDKSAEGGAVPTSTPPNTAAMPPDTAKSMGGYKAAADAQASQAASGANAAKAARDKAGSP